MPADTQDYDVTVVNEDNGQEKVFKAGPGAKVKAIIARIYNEWLKVEQKPDDRLRCESGENLFPLSDISLKELVEKKECEKLVFIFASATGGA